MLGLLTGSQISLASFPESADLSLACLLVNREPYRDIAAKQLYVNVIAVQHALSQVLRASREWKMKPGLVDQEVDHSLSEV